MYLALTQYFGCRLPRLFVYGILYEPCELSGILLL